LRRTVRSWAPRIRRKPPREPSGRTTRSASSRMLYMDPTRRKPLRSRSPTSSARRSCIREAEPHLTTAMSTPAQTNLLGLPRPELEAFVAELGSKPFRARQLMNWVYKRGEGSFAQMTDLAKDFRAKLDERAVIRTPEIVSVHKSA